MLITYGELSSKQNARFAESIFSAAIATAEMIPRVCFGRSDFAMNAERVLSSRRMGKIISAGVANLGAVRSSTNGLYSMTNLIIDSISYIMSIAKMRC